MTISSPRLDVGPPSASLRWDEGGRKCTCQNLSPIWTCVVKAVSVVAEAAKGSVMPGKISKFASTPTSRTPNDASTANPG